MNAIEVLERLDEWLGESAEAIEAARSADPDAAATAARTIGEQLARCAGDDPTADGRRFDTALRVSLDALLKVPGLDPRLPSDFNEFLLSEGGRADPADHRDARDRLYRAFTPLMQQLDPKAVPPPRPSPAAPSKPSRARTEDRRS